MRVYVYPADVEGCGQYRLIKAARALQAQGCDVVVEMPAERESIKGYTDDATGRVVGVEVPPDADVIVMQRLTYGPMTEAIPLIRAQGVAVVIDMDDDLSSIDPQHPAYVKYQPGTGGQHSWENAAAACRAATLVTTSTPALQQVYAPHGRGAVLYNCVPASYLDVPHVDSNLIGWAGSVPAHPGDIEVVGPTIRRLTGEGFPFKVVGPAYGVTKAFGLDTLPPTTGNVAFDEWPHAVATLGVGMVPLADSQFNRAKSWLKGLEMCAVGVPWVASSRVEYQRLHSLGAGVLAKKPQHWLTRLRELATNAALRQEMSQAGRAVAANHTVEGNAWRWWDAWTQAYKLQRQAATARATAGAVGVVGG